MILHLSSSLPNFRPISLKKGLNVLLANSVDDTKIGNTRNSAGKSSFVQLIDFLLGASARKGNLFQSPHLANFEFRGHFLVAGRGIIASRSGAQHTRIFLEERLGLSEGVEKVDKETGRIYISNEDWCKYLGKNWFGIPFNGDFEQYKIISYRSLIKYFIRLDIDGGFRYPEKAYMHQRIHSYQACLSYILGLDWRIVQEINKLKEEVDQLSSSKKLSEETSFAPQKGETSAIIFSKLTVAEDALQKKRDQVNSFEVLETYRETADKAAVLRVDLQKISQEIVILKQRLRYLEQPAIDDERESSMNVSAVYQSIGIELPGVALRRFDEVDAFHRSVTKNRFAHLKSEVEETKRKIELAEKSLEKIGKERQSLLTLLEGKGAFEDLALLHKDIAVLEKDHAMLLEKYRIAQDRDRKKDNFAYEKIKIKQRLDADYETHRENLEKSILRVSDIVKSLYQGDRNGQFEVDATDNGPKFSIKIDGDGGAGISSMEVFCMSIVLFESVRDRMKGPGFLIHDSHIFDGVDERQIMRSLEIGRGMLRGNEQYIITMNSDIFNKLRDSNGRNFSEHVITPQLSDGADDGGLFGFRFE